MHEPLLASRGEPASDASHGVFAKVAHTVGSRLGNDLASLDTKRLESYDSYVKFWTQQHADFNSSWYHARKLFHAFVEGSEMNIKQLKKALTAEKFDAESNRYDAALKNLFDELQNVEAAVKGSSCKGIGEQIFVLGLRQLKFYLLQDIYSACGASELLELRVDWCAESVVPHPWSPVQAPAWPTDPLPTGNSSWTHYEAPSEGELLKIGVKCGLPLLALDSLSDYRRTIPRTKYLSFDSTDVFSAGLLLEVFRLSDASRAMLKDYQAAKECQGARVAIEVELSTLYIATGGMYSQALQKDSEAETKKSDRYCRLVSILLGWVPFEQASSNHRLQRQKGARKQDKKALDGLKHAALAPGWLFEDVVQGLKDFSWELRISDTTWTMWKMVDVCVSNMAEVTEAFAARLDWFGKHFNMTRQDDLKTTKRTLEDLLTKLEQLCPVFPQLLAHPEFEFGVKRNFEDVEEKVKRLIWECSSCIRTCERLSEEIGADQDAKSEAMNYLLTLLASVLIPFQFLTGLYGMNFVDEDGKAVVPGIGYLTLDEGYMDFWGYGWAMTIGFVILFWITKKAHLLGT